MTQMISKCNFLYHILAEENRFSQNLNKANVSLETSGSIETFRNNLSIPHLSEEEKLSCEGRIRLEETLNGVNRLATKGGKYYRLPTKREKNYRLPTEKILTDYRHGPTLSIFVSKKKRSEGHFVFFFLFTK